MSEYVLILTALRVDGLSVHSVPGFESQQNAREAGEAWCKAVEHNPRDDVPGVACFYSVSYHREGAL